MQNQQIIDNYITSGIELCVNGRFLNGTKCEVPGPPPSPVPTVLFTNLQNSNMIIQITNFENPLKKYKPTNIAVDLSGLVPSKPPKVTIVIITDSKSVAFELPGNVLEINMKPDQNCLLPLLLAGKNSPPQITLDYISNQTLNIITSNSGISSTFFLRIYYLFILF